MNRNRGDGIDPADDAPPSSTFQLPHNSTQSQRPKLSVKERAALEHLKFNLEKDWRASFASQQFRDEATEELARVTEEAHDITRDTRHFGRRNLNDIAKERVEKRWKEQGIWNDKGGWKHEEPICSNCSTTPQQQREREASRPFHQFIYQMSQERRRIQDHERRRIQLEERWRREDEAAERPDGGPGKDLFWFPPPSWLPEPPQDSFVSEGAFVSHDVNTKAYQLVKDAWVKRGIWYDKWGQLPGMTWKHEYPLEDLLLEKFGPGSPYPPVERLFDGPADETDDDASNHKPGMYGLFSHLPGPIPSSLPSKRIQERAMKPPVTGLFSHLESSSLPQSTLSPILGSGRLQSKRKPGFVGSEEEDVAEPSQGDRTKKRRRTSI